ncbi:MAG: hypothetical protein GKR91_02515 [Pseudomonadales bacterium]|nr:hypothetical protein [Pseudomonadales bacterium]
MSSINKSDVASNPNSGSSIVKVAKSGKILPPDATERARQNLVEQYAQHIEPQNVTADKTGYSGDPEADLATGAHSSENDREQLRNDTIATAVTRLNDYVQNERRDLEFAVNEEAGVSIVKVISRHSRELIREIPGEEVVDLARKLNDQEPLRLFSAQV